MDQGVVMAQAAMLDAYRQSGRPLGPLHRVPVGIKDIIDTRICRPRMAIPWIRPDRATTPCWSRGCAPPVR